MSIPQTDEYSLGNIWTGLRNTDEVTCRDGECVDKLYWHSDGSVYNEHIPGHGVTMRGDICVRYKGRDKGFSDSVCQTYKRTVVCQRQFKCPETAGG